GVKVALMSDHPVIPVDNLMVYAALAVKAGLAREEAYKSVTINPAEILEAVKSGEKDYQFIEIMACPHGCVGGGGQPLPVDAKKKDARAKGLGSIDETSSIRKSHKNPKIIKLYNEFLGEPLSGEAHHLLHTSYKERPKN
ncbi:MAG: iron hydrogenase small subunit, partial [Halarsenatibacteraceae bacterium]